MKTEYHRQTFGIGSAITANYRKYFRNFLEKEGIHVGDFFRLVMLHIQSMAAIERVVFLGCMGMFAPSDAVKVNRPCRLLLMFGQVKQRT